MAVVNLFSWFCRDMQSSKASLTSHNLVFLRGISLSCSFVCYHHIHTSVEPSGAYGDNDKF